MTETTTTTKPWWQSKTVWLNALAGIVMVLQSTEMLTLLPAAWLPQVATVVALLNLLLRVGGAAPLSR